MDKPRVSIEEYYDGFAIHVQNPDDDFTYTWNFDQEDTFERMQTLFEYLGCDTTFEVVC